MHKCLCYHQSCSYTNMQVKYSTNLCGSIYTHHNYVHLLLTPIHLNTQTFFLCQQAYTFTLPHLLYCVCTTINFIINSHKCFNMLNCANVLTTTAQTCVLLLIPISTRTPHTSIHTHTHTHTPTKTLFIFIQLHYTNQNTG